MNRAISYLLLLTLSGLMGCRPSAREVVILSTNDIHARIEQFPRLATAVARCRDTAEVILVDAGDRWTGNAYVDLAEDRWPIVELMNRVGYDLAILGNHEFDPGQAVLERAVGGMSFPLICANMHSGEGAELKPFEASRTLTRGGLSLGFVGVVTNYGPNNHPDGHDAIFEGLTFTDAVQTAAEQAPTLAACDVRVLLSHVGLERDREIARATSDYDLIIGGHSHDRTNERVGGTLITQTGKNLHFLGAATVRLAADGTPELSFREVALEGYEPDPEVAALVASIKANPELRRPVGELTAPASRLALARLFAESIRTAAEADLGLYHYGGVRLDSLAAGPVALVDIYNVEPFGSKISTIEMTPADLRRLIISKFNDTVKPSESHCIDLFSTVPYTVITDGRDATDVRFPTLEEGRRYRVALGDYIFKTYRDVRGTDGTTTDLLVTDALLSLLASGPHTPTQPEQGIE